MSLFAQLYLAGMLTLSLPVLFHFLRRSPRGVMPFSSLMFLSPSPPRLTRRSRIDHWLLLLLRATALALLALAFCRPFFREDSRLGEQLSPGRKVAVLVDASASMRRAGLWQQAEQALDVTLKESKAQDDVALFAFDDRLRLVSDFPIEGQPHALQLEAVRKAFKTIEPTWGSTDLGDALATLATRLEATEDREGDEQPLQIVLISDIQVGADLAALQSISWPERVSVEVRPVATESINASIHVLERSLEETDPLAARLRIVNNHNEKLNIQLTWGAADREERAPSNRSDSQEPKPDEGDGDGEDEGGPLSLVGDQAFETLADGSKVVRVRRADDFAQADRVTVQGDGESFDNTCYIVPPSRRKVTVHFWGDDSKDDANGLRLYLENAAATAPHHELNVTATTNDMEVPSIETLTSSDLVVITRALSPEDSARARQGVMAGARVVFVTRDIDAAEALDALLPDGVTCELAEVDRDYALLTQIDFGHPLFAPLASARYSDFTKVQFWKHRHVEWNGDFESLRVLAKFDDGDLAIAQWPLGDGQVTLFTSGWNPRDSRLALSTKFVPLAAGLLDDSQTDRSALQFEVNEAVPRTVLGDRQEASNVQVAKPNGDVVRWKDGDFDDADQPGVYRVQFRDLGDTSRQVAELAFAVNLASSESRTKSQEPAVLAKNGVRMGQAVALGQLERQRQRLNRELENRQKLWQWLIAACLIVLIAETLLAARYARQVEVSAGQ